MSKNLTAAKKYKISEQPTRYALVHFGTMWSQQMTAKVDQFVKMQIGNIIQVDVNWT